MSLVLNTNTNALLAQSSLTASGSQLSTALQQLSSGLRINTAADDAAGYAIVQGMSAQIGGLNQAAQNASGGVSLTQTAQGALTEITNDLQTMRSLAVEALNATNNGTDRADLDQEFQQLSADIDSVAKSTQFNGVNLLDGTFSGATFQIGANAGQSITVAAVSSARTSALGQTYSASANTAAATSALAAGALVINGVGVGASASDGVSFANSSYSAIAVANAINGSNIAGLTATANATTVTAAAAPTAAGSAAGYTLANGDLVINGINVTGTVGTAQTVAATENDVIGAINAQTSLTGVVASDAGANKIKLTATDGRNITVTATANGTAASGFATATATTEGTVALKTINSSQSAAAINITTAASGISTASVAATLNSGTVSNANVQSVTSANAALASIDSALQTIASTGAQLGAYQDRFQAAITGLQTDSTNLQSARSSIQDTDYAQATTALSKAQILQQASTAMVAQANMIPQNVLSLLQKLP
jgi:flagellin